MVSQLPSPALLLGVLSSFLAISRDFPGTASAAPSHGEPFEVIFEVERLEQKLPGDPSSSSFTVKVHPDWSPLGAQRFRELIEAGFYDECRFFRVIENFMAQFGISGDPEVAKVWREKHIKDDPKNYRVGNRRGKLSFAMAGRDTRTTQIFINFKHNDQLDSMGFTPFGEVTSGMNVVDRIYKGYGEGAPSGRGPHQGLTQKHGNPYLEKEFPKLSYIKSARIKVPFTAPVTQLPPAASGASPQAPLAALPANAPAASPAASASLTKPPAPKLVECELTTGWITIEVHTDWAPLGSKRFLELVEAHYFDNSALFRAIKGFLVQFGISGNERLRYEWQGKAPIVDDPLQPDVPVKLGTMAFAGSGKNSRTTQVWIAFSGNDKGLGTRPWETPFAQVVGSKSLAAVQRIATDYGDTVVQGQIWQKGNSYLKSNYPKLDYIKTCQIANSTSVERPGAAAGFLESAGIEKQEEKKDVVDAASTTDGFSYNDVRNIAVVLAGISSLAFAWRFFGGNPFKETSGKDTD